MPQIEPLPTDWQVHMLLTALLARRADPKHSALHAAEAAVRDADFIMQMALGGCSFDFDEPIDACRGYTIYRDQHDNDTVILAGGDLDRPMILGRSPEEIRVPFLGRNVDAEVVRYNPDGTVVCRFVSECLNGATRFSHKGVRIRRGHEFTIPKADLDGGAA